MSGEGDGNLAAHIATTTPARTSIDITTPLSLRSILRQPPDAATFARTPFDIGATSIGCRSRCSRAPPAGPSASPARCRRSWRSPARLPAPKGTVAIDVAGAAMGRFPPTDARIELDFDPGAVDARARVTRKGRPLLAAETRVGAPLGGLFGPRGSRPRRSTCAPCSGPLALQRLGLPPETDREPPRELKGKLHADLTIDGTVGAPRVLFHAQAGDLALDKVAVGFAQIEATYADRQGQAGRPAHLAAAAARCTRPPR